MKDHRFDTCPDCDARPGERHKLGCDVERCPRCGRQLLSCPHYLFGAVKAPPDEERLPWTGEWPGVQECRELGWYCKRNPDGSGWVPCTPDHPGATEHLSRLRTEAIWDPEQKRFVLPGTSDLNRVRKNERGNLPTRPKMVRIQYAPDETGSAQLLGNKTARIVDVPVLNPDLWRDDIVRLTHGPGDSESLPEIAKVLWRKYEARTHLYYHEKEEADTLMGILRLVHADAAVIIEAKEGSRGVVAVAHPEFMDPIGLANAIGIAQPDEEVTEDEEEATTEGEEAP